MLLPQAYKMEFGEVSLKMPFRRLNLEKKIDLWVGETQSQTKRVIFYHRDKKIRRCRFLTVWHLLHPVCRSTHTCRGVWLTVSCACWQRPDSQSLCSRRADGRGVSHRLAPKKNVFFRYKPRQSWLHPLTFLQLGYFFISLKWRRGVGGWRAACADGSPAR